MNYLLLFLAVFSFNILPAFAPPTWTILVLFRLHSHLNPVALVIVGALGSSTGRALLANATYLLRSKVSHKMIDNLEAAKAVLNKNPRSTLLGMSLFAISPLPSAQLFEAAGLISLRIFPLAIAFFCGRLVSYSFFVAGASTLKSKGLSDIFIQSLTSPVGIALEILMIAAVYGLTQINWIKILGRMNHNSSRSL